MIQPLSFFKKIKRAIKKKAGKPLFRNIRGLNKRVRLRNRVNVTQADGSTKLVTLERKDPNFDPKKIFLDKPGDRNAFNRFIRNSTLTGAGLGFTGGTIHRRRRAKKGR